jgi:thioredoxin reductase (NADPH)
MTICQDVVGKEADMERFDIAIIGTGPAGLSAAITSKLRNKKIILLGSPTLSEKVEKAHEIQNYLGIPAASGAALSDSFQKHIHQMGIEITPVRVTAVYMMGNFYAIQTTDGNYEASAIILATGVHMDKTCQGEEKYLGRGVSYCATCDAALYRGKTVAVVGYSPKEEREVQFLSEMAGKVFYFPQYEQKPELSAEIMIVREKPIEVRGVQKANKLVTQQGEYDVDGIFFLRESVSPAQLVPGLLMEEKHIAVNRQMETNLAGCFACGDATGMPYQYMKAAGEGNVAALSAVRWLAQEERKV